MPTIPTSRVNITNNIDIVNAIRNDATTYYQEYVPVVHNADELRSIGATIMSNVQLQNEFLTSLINRIGKVMVRNVIFSNPLKPFKKGILEFGESIEDIYVNLPEAFDYDPEVAESKLFARVFPDVRSAFYVKNYEKFYKQTIQRRDLQACFLSTNGISDLITKVIGSMKTKAEADEYLMMKYMLAKWILDGKSHVKTITSGSTTEATAKKMLTEIRTLGNIWETSIRRDYNLAGVQQTTPKSNQWLIINAKFEAEIDVNALAYAFHMDKADVQQHVIMIDEFSSIDDTAIERLLGEGTALTPAEKTALDSIACVMVDGDFFQVYDNLMDISENVRNAEGLYDTYFLHTWRTFNICPFSQSNVFALDVVSGVSSLTVTPTTGTLSLTAGQSVQLIPTVETTGFASKAVVYDTTNTDITVSSSGLITVKPGATAKTNVTVNVTSVADTSKKVAWKFNIV